MRTLELFDLSRRVAIVNGGASGLGRELAGALAELGADVVVCARDASRCEAAAAELAELGVRTLGLGCDVRSKEQVGAVVARTLEQLGSVDVLVNSAGTSWDAAPDDVPQDDWETVIGVHLTGVFLFCQAAGRAMIEGGRGGRIVNVASGAAFRGAAPEPLDAVPYDASKGGVVALTRDLSAKWARHGVRVNAIATGWFPPDGSHTSPEGADELLRARVPLGRLGGPDDLKGAVAFLASAASDFVTGHTLVVDGGQLVAG